jgi:hypothetical protein
MMAGIMHVNAMIEQAMNDYAMNEYVMNGFESRLFLVDSPVGAISRPADRDFALGPDRDHDND